jgi:sugar lactone lactonase YvrE
MRKVPVIFIASVALMLLPARASLAADAVKMKYFRSVYTDDKEVGLRAPEGVGCDDKGQLFVADSGNGRLVQFTVRDGNISLGKEIKVPEISVPIRLHIDSKGDIFALDGRHPRIVRLGPAGEYRGKVDATGTPSPKTIVPRSFVIGKDDSLYLLDVFAGRVLILTPGGKFAKQIYFPEGYEVISDLAVDRKGNIYLIDSVKAIVYVATIESGKFSALTESMKEKMEFPATMMTDDRGNIYLADKNKGVIYLLDQNGSFKGEQLRMGWDEGRLRHPSQMCINDRGEIFVADRDNNRVQIFSTVR